MLDPTDSEEECTKSKTVQLVMEGDHGTGPVRHHSLWEICHCGLTLCPIGYFIESTAGEKLAAGRLIWG